MLCDCCYEKLTEDCVLKNPCNHRIHKKCETKDGECKACKTNADFKKFSDYGLLIFMGTILGLVVGCLLWCGSDGVHKSVRELEASLSKMAQWADRSVMTRAVVERSLGRIKACIEKEMLHVMHN